MELKNTVALLERTPAALDGLLRGLPEMWTTRDEGDGTWTVFDVVGHLLHAERTDWMPRVKTILQFGESRPFDAFDRSGHMRGNTSRSLEDLLDEFSRERRASLEELRALHPGPGEFALRGQHPTFGPVTLSQLLATWAAHDLTHLHQISRIMAHQYRDAVGPWSAFLGVMRCGGHGS